MRILAILLAVGVAAPALADQPKPAADKDKLICKREVPIGSLIASRKMCLTKAQWTQREEDGNRETRRLMEENTTRQTSN
jgi:predicted secreted protein